jgi:uncharacterized phage protein (TIGR02220 family)
VYGKLFEQMFDGTLATKGPWQALVTFQQLIILADRNGDVDMTPEAISRRTTIPLEIIRQGLSALEQPDKDSRSPALEGRRIVRLSEDRAWGWNIVNYTHYRAIRSQEERREYMRNYQRQRRFVNQNVNKSTRRKQSQPIAVSRGSKQNEEVKDTVGPKPDIRALRQQAVEILNFLNEKTGRNYQPLAANIDLIVARLKDGATVEDCKQVIAKKARAWKGDAKMDEYLRPATLFNRTKFAQYQGELGAK